MSFSYSQCLVPCSFACFDLYRYYKRISADIENDEYFALMISNAWRLDAPSSNRFASPVTLPPSRIPCTEEMQHIKKALGSGRQGDVSRGAQLLLQMIAESTVRVVQETGVECFVLCANSPDDVVKRVGAACLLSIAQNATARGIIGNADRTRLLNR